MAITQALKSQVIIVPSADAGSTLITADILIGVTLRWIKPTTAGHGAVVQDSDSNSVWQATCATNNVDVPDSLIPVLNGLKVTTLQSGTLEIHYSDRKTLVTTQGQPMITNTSPIS